MKDKPVIRHGGEKESNLARETWSQTEPLCLRTETASMAVLQRSEGSYHYTPEGRKLADFTSGVLVCNLGHHPRSWWNRVWNYMGLDCSGKDDESQFLSAVALTAYNALTEVEVQANRRLLANLQNQSGGSKLEEVLWAASGSEAVQKGLWACLDRRPGQDIMLATRGGFHGKKGLAGAVTGCETDPERDPRVRFISFPKEECSTFERRQKTLNLTSYVDELEEIWNELGNRICCLITEPYLGGGGSYHPQKEYLQMLQSFCSEHDIVFILDEIQSNFGRTGSMYAFSEYGIEPDMVALGKGMGNGIPVDAIVGRSDLFAPMKYGEGSDTWSAHPLGCAAVLATLDEFESTDILDRGRELSKVLEKHLLELTDLPVVGAVRGEGTVWGLEFSACGKRSAEEMAHEAVRRCYLGNSEGKAIHLLGPLAGKVIRIAPPLNMFVEEAEDYLMVLREILSRLPEEKSV